VGVYRAHVLVCAGAGCVSSGCREVEVALNTAIDREGLADEVRVVQTGCMGPCDMGPVVIVYPEGVFYKKLKAEDAERIVTEHLVKGRIVQDLAYRQPGEEQVLANSEEIPFFNRQTRIALRNTGLIDPEAIEEYIARDGYSALGKALSAMKPEDVIDEILESGLRGRGGAGFPTGLKWRFTAKADGSPKYVVCNADEGDPGAFMDRSILEGDPHTVIEAMTIAAYAVGADQGYVYVRAEYPLAVERLGKAIEQARGYGFLGDEILGTEFGFDLDIRVGAGAFVCGEETALINSLMGQRGEPRPRPPYPANEGVWGKPTVLNNVETYANVPAIILMGAERYAAIGTENSKGTKVFALAGNINNTGLVEVPMGTPLGEIVYDIGGGVPDGGSLKAIQTGGPSGGCIPVGYLNTAVDYDSLKDLGTIMGSGGLIVMDENTCMVDLAKFFLEFVQEESCGKCAPCRVGTKRMLEVLDRITKGQGKEGDIELLEELAYSIRDSALCGLGQSAPNPVLSTLRYFRHEYEEHIRDKYCRASVCAALFTSPCQNTCPAGVDVPIYVEQVNRGDFVGAYETVLTENPFPVVCGRVCNHPCETKCRRGQLDEPISIRLLKRFASDYATNQKVIPSTPRVGTARSGKVAVIGAGPSGLTAGYFLGRAGYDVTVFEAQPVAGGMLAVGIPDYRLPRQALQRDIDYILSQGVKLKTNTPVGKSLTLKDLKSQGFDAVYVAVGAQEGRALGIPGEDKKGVLSGLEFLRQVNIGEDLDLKGRSVVVIGGGNVAFDAARSALRLGASAVEIVYRRRREDMPAQREEIIDAEEEGIRISTLVTPIEVTGNSTVQSLKCLKNRLGAFDRSGRRRPEPIEDSEFVIKANVVISAIGQNVKVPADLVDAGLEVDSGGCVVADSRTGATSLEGVFAGGDCVTGPDFLITAIAAGKKAARELDRYMGYDGNLIPKVNFNRTLDRTVSEEEMPRQKPMFLQEAVRIGTFDEVELGLREDAACREAGRCLRCDVKDDLDA